METHSSKKSKKCDRSSASNLLAHLKTHRREMSHKCSQCEYVSPFKRHLWLICEDCNFKARTNSLLKKHILYQHKGNKTFKNTCKKMYIKTADTNATTVVFQQPRNETCRFTRRYNSEKLFKYKQCSYEGNQKISVYNDLWILCDCCDYKTSQKIFNAAYN